jgi:hypothetical protein
MMGLQARVSRGFWASPFVIVAIAVVVVFEVAAVEPARGRRRALSPLSSDSLGRFFPLIIGERVDDRRSCDAGSSMRDENLGEIGVSVGSPSTAPVYGPGQDGRWTVVEPT